MLVEIDAFKGAGFETEHQVFVGGFGQHRWKVLFQVAHLQAEGIDNLFGVEGQVRHLIFMLGHGDQNATVLIIDANGEGSCFRMFCELTRAVCQLQLAGFDQGMEEPHRGMTAEITYVDGGFNQTAGASRDSAL